MATIKKAQGGGLIKKVIKEATKNAPKVSKWDYPTKKSRNFQRDFLEAYPEKIKKMPTGTNKIDKVKEVKPKYDKNGLEILKDKNGGAVKKKMRNGGSLSGLKASTKRVGPVDPKGAFTKVQKKTLAGAKGKATLTKDKQLGATKMAKKGMSVKKK
jgi:hypothetical protein